MVTHVVAPPVSGVYHGRDGLLQALLDWAEGFDELVSHSGGVHRRRRPGRCPSPRQRARGAESGVPVETDVWYLSTRSAPERSCASTILVNRKEALEAAGLKE